jgi:hypothetical protein
VGLKVGFSLDQFSEILKVRDAAGKPYILIGGQAVNYWAERYLEREPQLKALGPSTSADLDFKGTGGGRPRHQISKAGSFTQTWPLDRRFCMKLGIPPHSVRTPGTVGDVRPFS